MEITVHIPAPFQAGSALGTYSIHAIPCSGSFKVLALEGEAVRLRAEDQQGDCGEADSDSLAMQADGTLLYVSRGEGREARGILQRVDHA